ncbi:MAG: 16S rRNA processing protein RimM [Oscillospiraceae bacterium]|nr:16S rRNA processing protein RimM [Oscillospiraceae bacterium]
MQKRYLEIGKIVAVQGLKGEVRVEPWCDSGDFLCEFDTLYFDKGEKKLEIVRSRVQKNIVIMKIKDIDTVEQAQNVRNKILYMDREDVELEEGAYFVQDLIGLSVIDADSGADYGKLCQVSPTGANDVYHIKDADGRIRLIPAIPDVVLETNITDGIMKIHVLEGLFDED